MALTYISRNLELIKLQDKDIIAICQDRVTKNPGVTQMKLKLKSTSPSSVYETVSPAILKDDRCLMYVTLNFGKNQSVSNEKDRNYLKGSPDKKIVPYIDNNDYSPKRPATTGVIKPLREVINPRYEYDLTTGRLTIWFWTNFRDTYDPVANGYSDDALNLYRIDEVTYVTGAVATKRTLCYAFGTIEKFWVEGGGIDADYTAVDDLVPLFTKPRIAYVMSPAVPILDFVKECACDCICVPGTGTNINISSTLYAITWNPPSPSGAFGTWGTGGAISETCAGGTVTVDVLHSSFGHYIGTFGGACPLPKILNKVLGFGPATIQVQ